MKRQAPWLLAAFVLALLLTLGLGPDRPTRVFLDSPIVRTSYLDVSRFLVSAVAIMVPAVRPAKFWLHLEATQNRAGPDQCLPLLSNFSLDRAPLRADDTGPPAIDLCGPYSVASSRGCSCKARRARRRPPKGGTTLRTREK